MAKLIKEIPFLYDKDADTFLKENKEQSQEIIKLHKEKIKTLENH